MSEALTNVATIISIVCIIITAIFVIHTIKESRQNDKDAQAAVNEIKTKLDDYNSILEATHEIELNREKNKGEHFEDESIYLHRANQIRVNSPFFSWVKL